MRVIFKFLLLQHCFRISKFHEIMLVMFDTPIKVVIAEFIIVNFERVFKTEHAHAP